MHLMLAPLREFSVDLLLHVPSLFPTSSFTLPSAFICSLFHLLFLYFPFLSFLGSLWVILGSFEDDVGSTWTICGQLHAAFGAALDDITSTSE